MFRRSGDWFADKNMRHSRSWPERQRQAQQPDEDRDREGDHHRREREILERTHVARGVGADEHEHRGRGDEPEPLQRYAEQHDRQQRNADRPQVKARHRLALERERPQCDDRPEHGKQRAHQGRKHGRSHAMHVAEPVLKCEKDEAAADRDEDQPRPEILRRTDAHYSVPQLAEALLRLILRRAERVYAACIRSRAPVSKDGAAPDGGSIRGGPVPMGWPAVAHCAAASCFETHRTASMLAEADVYTCAAILLSMRPSERTASIRPDVRLLDDRAEALGLLL